MNRKSNQIQIDRLRATKLIEKKYSQEVISNFKYKENEVKLKDEFTTVIQQYKEMCKEIEDLKSKKQEMIDAQTVSQKLTEEKNLMLKNYLDELDSKKKKFDEFMKEKGKEALQRLKKENEEKKQKIEEIKCYEQKKVIKEAATSKARYTAQTIKRKDLENKAKEQLEIMNEKDNPNDLKIRQIYHPFGNKIDYSTTKFHNVLIVRHEIEKGGIGANEHLIDSRERAKVESNITKQRTTSKELSKTKFDKEIKMNSYEAIKELKKKESLAKLEKELKQLNMVRATQIKCRIKSKSKEKVIESQATSSIQTLNDVDECFKNQSTNNMNPFSTTKYMKTVQKEGEFSEKIKSLVPYDLEFYQPHNFPNIGLHNDKVDEELYMGISLKGKQTNSKNPHNPSIQNCYEETAEKNNQLSYTGSSQFMKHSTANPFSNNMQNYLYTNNPNITNINSIKENSTQKNVFNLDSNLVADLYHDKKGKRLNTNENSVGYIGKFYDEIEKLEKLEDGGDAKVKLESTVKDSKNPDSDPNFPSKGSSNWKLSKEELFKRRKELLKKKNY